MADPVGTNSALRSALECVLGLKGTTLAAGAYADLEVPFPCSIFRWTMLGDTTGSGVVDLLRCTEAQYDAGATHPTSGDSITAGAPPTIAGATKGQSTPAAGWATALNAGDVIRFNLNSVSTLSQITISLDVFRGVWS